jgi:hypothetical protein
LKKPCSRAYRAISFREALHGPHTTVRATAYGCMGYSRTAV